MTYDITFERDQLDRADPPADWGDEIPVLGEVYPADADPAFPPTPLEADAAAAFDRVLAETGDLFAAWEALCAELDGGVEAVLDACNEDLISVRQTADRMRELDGDGAMLAEPDKSQGIMFK